jgi:hypothetical protein
MDQRNAGNSRGAVTEMHGWHCLSLCELAPERITGAVLQNPIGFHENRDTWDDIVSGFEKTMPERDPSLTSSVIRKFGHKARTSLSPRRRVLRSRRSRRTAGR